MNVGRMVDGRFDRGRGIRRVYLGGPEKIPTTARCGVCCVGAAVDRSRCGSRKSCFGVVSVVVRRRLVKVEANRSLSLFERDCPLKNSEDNGCARIDMISTTLG
jgi:hypothetical protein